MANGDSSWTRFVDHMLIEQKNAAVCLKTGSILAASPDFTHIQSDEIQRLVDNPSVDITLAGVKYQRVGDIESPSVTGFNLKIKDSAGMTCVALTKTLVVICQGEAGSPHYRTINALLNIAEYLMNSGY